MNEMQKEQAREFLRHVASASAKLEQAKEIEAKAVEMPPAKHVNKGKISKAIKELESKITSIADEESKLLAAQEKGSELVEALSRQISELGGKIAEISRHDTDAIESVKAEIKILEADLLKARKIRKIEGVDDLSAMISDLKAKMEQMLNAEEEHQKRVQELEAKIDRNVSNSYAEILKVENMITDMEKKYELMQKEGKYDQTALDMVREKIMVLKEKLGLKKDKLAMALAKPVPKMLPAKPLEIPKILKPLIRHEMRITPVPPKPPEHIIKLLEEKPKRGIFSRMLFGGK